MQKIVFLVQEREEDRIGVNLKVIVTAEGRETAKSRAHVHIGGDSDRYIVTPLSGKKDFVKFDIII